MIAVGNGSGSSSGSGSGSTNVSSISTATPTSVPVTISSGQGPLVNLLRKYWVIVSDSASTGNILVGLGFIPTTSLWSYSIPPGQSYESILPAFTGQINLRTDVNIATAHITEGT